MRVTSALWVSALIRRYEGIGANAVVVRRGATEAGAIFIIVDRLTVASDLYGPAPQAVFEAGDEPGERRFQQIAAEASAADVSARLASERRFDPDLWIVAIEDRDGRILFEAV